MVKKKFRYYAPRKLTIYDGDSENAVELVKYCYSLKPPSLTSSTTNLFLVFETSMMEGSGKGFMLEYHPYKA